MGIPLKEAMSIFPLSEAKLLAGAQGLDRMVESANIQEVPDVEKWLHGGEILFSAGYALQSLKSGAELLRRIDKMGAAAMALKPGPYLKNIPQEMIDCANEIGLPLFELPEQLPYMDCILPLFERITEKQLYLLRRVELIYERLMQTILRDEGLDGICATLTQVTSRMVFIASPTGKLLAWCAQQGEVAPLRKLFGRYCTKNSVHRLHKNQCNAILLEQGQQMICVPVFAQDEHVAYLVLDNISGEMQDMDLLAFEHASSLIAIELLKERALVEKEQKVREKLLEDILMKRYSDEQMIYRRALSVGLDMEKAYCIFIIDPDSFERYINQEMAGSSELEIQKIKAHIQELIRQGMQAYEGRYLLLNNSVSVVGLISIQQDADAVAGRSVLQGILHRLKQSFPKLGFFAGMGRVKYALRDADISWREAKLAVNCGRTQHTQKTNVVTCFGELGARTFLCELTQSRTMQDYYAENMDCLLRYDRENGSELVETLRQYFLCGQNLRITSEKMFVHKNSISYRLKKIETLIGKNLTEGTTSFDLQLCLLLKDVL